MTSTPCLLGIVGVLTAGLSLAGCTTGEDNACASESASNLVEAAEQSGVLQEVPAAWKARPVYAECDRDDEFVVAGRVLTAAQPDLDRYLEQQGVARGADADGEACRTILVDGQSFYVETGLGTGGTYVELKHYLTFENPCRTVTSGTG